MIPVAGSAYTYSYATMGELIAWIIGWDLVLEYTVAATTVSISWSRYLVVFLEGLDIHLPQALTACPWDGGIVNIPAFLIVVLMSIFLIRGTEGSSIFNGIVVFLKVSVIAIFVVTGLEIYKCRQLYSIHPRQYRYTWRIRSLGCPAWSRHRFLCFPRIRCRQYSCTGNKKSETEYADRYPEITLGMYRTLYAVCPRNDRSSPLYRI